MVISELVLRFIDVLVNSLSILIFGIIIEVVVISEVAKRVRK